MPLWSVIEQGRWGYRSRAVDVFVFCFARTLYYVSPKMDEQSPCFLSLLSPLQGARDVLLV